MNEILKDFVLSAELFDYWEEQKFEFSDRESASIIYNSRERWSKKKIALQKIADKTEDKILKDDVIRCLYAGSKSFIQWKRTPLEKDNFAVPHPFRKGDIVKLLSFNNEYGVVNNFIDDNEFYGYIEEARKRAEIYPGCGPDTTVRVEMFFSERKDIAHYHISPLDVRHLTDIEMQDCPEELKILSQIYQGDAYVSDLLYVLHKEM